VEEERLEQDDIRIAVLRVNLAAIDDTRLGYSEAMCCGRCAPVCCRTLRNFGRWPKGRRRSGQ